MFESNEQSPMFDMIGEIPWKNAAMEIHEKRELENGSHMHPFSVSTGIGAVSFKFYCKSGIEMRGLKKKFESWKEKCLKDMLETRELTDSLKKQRSFLLNSERYHKKCDSTDYF